MRNTILPKMDGFEAAKLISEKEKPETVGPLGVKAIL
jgi:hypothetical protein